MNENYNVTDIPSKRTLYAAAVNKLNVRVGYCDITVY